MEENLMERLLNDFNGVLEEFNQLVANKDIDGVRRVLNEVNRLIQEQNGIVLDDREPQYDHVLHELLSKMNGVIELAEKTRGIDFEPGTRLYTNVQVQEMITDVENQLRIQAEKLRVGRNENNEQMIAEAESERQNLLAELSRLQDAIVPNAEYSNLTYIDENLKALQEERARLVEEKQNNIAEIERLRTGQTFTTAANPENQARLDEINSRISELEQLIPNLENQINDIKGTNISELIASLRNETNNRNDLVSRRETLQEQLRAAGDRVRETRGFDEAYAQARADYSALVQQISDLDAQIERTNSAQENIEFLESFLPDIEQREEVLDPMDYTYMGRLSDEQIIRRLLSEQLHLSEEEINETIGEYSLVPVDDGAHDEQGEDNPISMRQLVRTVREPITVQEAYERNISELESRRAALQEQLRAAGNRVRETRGFDEAYAQARADYSALVQQISDIENEINSFKERFNEATGIKAEEARIAAAKREQEELRSRREQLEQDTSRQENPEIRDRLNKLKEISGIAALELQIQQAKDEISKLQEERTTLVPAKGEPSKEDSERIAALEARNREIDARIVEIDQQIEQIPGIHIPGKESQDKLDITAEAQKIGDKIFKTAKIRRELADRQISRDEFLAFYKEGYTKTNQQIDQLGEDYKKILAEMKTIIVDTTGTGKRIDKQIEEAEASGNTELATKLYEQMRKNFVTAGREQQLKDLGLDHEITSPEDVEKMKQFFQVYKTSVEKGIKDIKLSINELRENAQIFLTEISRIQAEKATIEIAGESPEELEAKSAARKDLRRKLLEASITPEKDLTDEQIELLEDWQNSSERFLSKKTTGKYIYIDRDGKEQIIDVDTIAEYDEYAADIDFLGVPAYKENLEQISAYNQTKDPYVFGEEVGRKYDEAEAEREGAGEEVLARIMADKQKYVETFNGIPNPHKVKYENWKTAGSTLKGMKPVSKDLPMPTRAKNALENVGRFLGIRVPKFTRKDEHGNDVRDIKGGITTLALDGLVAGAVIGSAVTIGPALAVAGYAAKGIVTLGNKIAARVEYSKHKDEIDNNTPVINQADRNAREVARKAYYREQGDNRLVAWAKAKADKYFTRTREKETEQAIVDGLMTEFEEVENARNEALKSNIELGRKNQEARQARQRQIAMSANTYNDIVRDPDSIDMDEATATIARNAALESMKTGAGIEDVNANSKAQRKEQYVKQEGPVAKTEDLDEAAFAESADGPVSAITAEQIYTGRKQHVDRLNRILTIVTTAGLKFGYTAWKDGFTQTDVIHHDAEMGEKVVHHDAEYGEVDTPIHETQYDTSKTLEELRQNYAGKTADEYYSVSGGLAGQRTEALVDKGITAGWFDDKSAWGTGISDTHGLTAPTLTERLADTGLLDANGMLRQDITVQQLLDGIGCQNADLSTLDGIYVSVGDKYWVALSDLMDGMTKDVVVGTQKATQLIKEAYDETVPYVIKEAYDENVTRFAPELIGKAIRDGAIAGTAIAAADALHEAAQTTYIDGATPGRPEEVTPEAKDSFDKIAEKLQKQANIERENNRRREEEEKQEEHDDDGR